MEPGTVTYNYLHTVVNAVSGGYVSRDDLHSRDSTAKIRTRVGIRLYRDKLNKEVATYNFVYSALFALISGIGNYTEESFEKNSNNLYENLRKLFAATTGTKYEQTGGVSDDVREMASLYNYLFAK